jgi:hypothetical protein
LWVENEEGEVERAWPEDLLAQYGHQPPAASSLAQAASLPNAIMEPNQALAHAAQIFPREARLRKSGYRLDQHSLILTFDFPDAARERYAQQIAALEEQTGWSVEVTSEANQAALFSLLPSCCRLAGGSSKARPFTARRARWRWG